MMFLFGSVCAICIAAMVIAGIWARYGLGGDAKVLRAAYRELETKVRTAQESSTLALHDLNELRERLADQRDADRARVARCEIQGELNERNMVKLGNQFKDAVADVKQEGTKLSLLVGSQGSRKGF